MIALTHLTQAEVGEAVKSCIDLPECFVFLTGEEVTVSDYVEAMLIDEGKNYWVMKDRITSFPDYK